MLPPSIHILGIGNLGKLLAHSIRRRHPNIPITLLFHRPSLEEEWKKAGQCVDIVRGGISDRVSGFHHEFLSTTNLSQDRDPIQNLIVATKTHSTVQGLRPLKGRLLSTSTMLFLQNGIGTIDEVTRELFHSPESRPTYLAGIFNHGVYATSIFSSVHAGLANAFIGRVYPAPEELPSNPKKPFLAQTIADCPELAVSLVTPQNLLYIQLQKLTVNAVINPLTAIFDCFNGELFESSAIRGLVDRSIEEISAVIIAVIESKSKEIDEDVRIRFSPANLKDVICKVGEQTAKNISSMRQDVMAGRKTEIDYINGYIVIEGNQHGISCPVNEKIADFVREKQKISESDITKLFIR